MVIKWGRHGKFPACSGYPECKNTREIADERACPEGAVEVEKLKRSAKIAEA
jgi:ssDNA-binding Zn-finger/Zn-ribbon topoisomerase 1